MNIHKKNIPKINEVIFPDFPDGHACAYHLTVEIDPGLRPGSPGQGPGRDCGCDPEDVAFKNIVGYGKAICTKAGKKSGKKSVWTLTCGKI